MMAYPLIFAAFWVLLALALAGSGAGGAASPVKGRAGWIRLGLLVITGVPILGLIVQHHGPWIGLMVLGAALALLRWPLSALWRSLSPRKFGAKE